ncbi:helix-turn-helix domain-containing protein [Alkalicoccus luteus]|uniref:Helix-turn-helix transcriptional regulator n=1 Tax=Alkalicoccus luteus TaxID=1237094 RepID=A0A969PY34_9BACI|nr:helix-turn-helix transcriptional regulator [Alkalicoccus luteus]NJP37682.1 helix-turn-helix transcriptional regulator [Alkalicoccus luteus]
MSIGDLIRHERKRKGWTLSQLSRRTGVSKSYLSYLERNQKKNPSITIVKRLFVVLDIPLDKIMDKDEQKADYS